jgi:holin-like protein
VNPAPFLPGLAWLLVCQSIGEVLSRMSHVGLPGPVVGMMLMLGLLGWESVRAQVSTVANGLLMHLSLLFVPVGVGVMTHMALVSRYGWQLLVTLVVSTWIGLLVTAVIFRALLRRSEDTPSS